MREEEFKRNWMKKNENKGIKRIEGIWLNKKNRQGIYKGKKQLLERKLAIGELVVGPNG